MAKIVLSISAGLLLSIVCASSAFAQSNAGSGSIKIDKNALGKADKIIRSRPQIEILDESPIIKDRRQPIQGPDTLEINLPPVPVIPGKHTVIGSPSSGAGSAPIIMNGSNNLMAPTSDMHRSKISPRPAVDTSNLPNGTSTGVHGPTGAAASGNKYLMGKLKPQGNPVSASPSQPVAAQNYHDYKGSGSSSGNVTIKNEVKGKLTSPLKKRLTEN